VKTYRLALEEAEKLGDFYLYAVILANLGKAETQRAAYVPATALLDESLRILRGIGAEIEYAQALVQKGRCISMRRIIRQRTHATGMRS